MNSRDRFEGWAAGYDASVERSEAADAFPFAGYRDVLQRTVDLVEPRSGQRVLDVGVGTGGLSRRLLDRGCDVVGADFSPAMLARTTALCPELHPVEADLRDPKALMGVGTFDRIVAGYVLHEFPWTEGVSMLRRWAEHLLASDGRIVVGDILFPDATQRDRVRADWPDRWDAEEHYWVVDELRPAWRAAGLRDEHEQISFCGGVVRLQRAAERDPDSTSS